MTEILNPTGSVAPLLTYGLQLQPDPLQAGGHAVLNLVVSNATDDKITCYSIQLTLPVGTDATDLIDGSATIATQPASGWSANVQGGVVTFTPPGGSAVIEGGGLVFTIATTANAQPGTATVTLQETASDDGGPRQQGSGGFSFNKFPAGFSLSDLTAVPANNLNIPYGQPAALNWTALGQGVSCTLQYTPSDAGPSVSTPVPNIPPGGKFETQPLTRSGDVIFTLIASVSILGQDNPLTVQRQLAVSVQRLSLEVMAQPPVVGINGLAGVTWNALNADYCTLDDGTRVGVTGTYYVVLKASRAYTITAFGAGDQSEQRQVQVTVDPTIVPTEGGFDYQAQGGYDGMNWNDDPDDPRATPGSWGHSAQLSVALPPLDTTGQSSRVVPVTCLGGKGGDGGLDQSGKRLGGGGGGNAQLALGWDPKGGTPAQFIITVAGGRGGQTGGPAGSASGTIGGQALVLL